MKYLAFAFTTILFLSCTPESKNPDKRLEKKEVPENFDIGKSVNGQFSNEYYGLSFEYNEDWNVFTYEELEELMELGANEISGSNTKLKEALNANSVRTAHHFGASKFDKDSYMGFNPSILVISENIKRAKLKYGDQYLEHTRDLWPQLNVDIDQIGVIEEKLIDGKQFFILTAKINGVGVDVFQKYYCTIIKGFALLFVQSYSTESELNEFNVLFESMRFKQ